MKMELFVTLGDVIGLILVVAIIVGVSAVYGIAVLVVDRWEKRQQKKSEKFWEDK